MPGDSVKMQKPEGDSGRLRTDFLSKGTGSAAVLSGVETSGVDRDWERVYLS